mgnify:CR=1 FL=1
MRGYTFGVLATRADVVDKMPDRAAAAVRALVKTQHALKADPKRATKVGEKWFDADLDDVPPHPNEKRA